MSDRAGDALEMISAGLDLLLSEGLDPICAETATDAIREVESAGRRIVAAQTMILGSVRRRCLHTRDGHASAKVMVRHVAKLSGGEATAREKTAMMLAALEQVE
ncbi:MAG: HNH endonuclease, partial [Actinobacteria bacterium]|nr:HNH endonuclease [Actinomycetota bacterium]